MADSGFDPSELYEAILDDAQFAALPATLARQFDSRSAVIHWLGPSNASLIDAHSGHFSDADMAQYSERFAADDIWTRAALSPAARNRAWDSATLVDPADFESSVFYNEWIRAIGDDTYHCAGAVMETRHGFGIVGLHRARRASPYERDTIRRLAAAIPHLRRALTLRGELVARHGALRSWEQAFASAAQPTLVLDRLGRAIKVNDAAALLLRSGSPLSWLRQRPQPTDSRQAADWASGLARATAPSPEAGQIAFGDPPLLLWLAEFLPLVSGTMAGCAMVTLIDRSPGHGRPGPAHRIAALYGLTAAECQVALLLAQGATVAEIAEGRRTTLETTRYQVKQVLAKTGSRRQSDVVSLVLRLTLA